MGSRGLRKMLAVGLGLGVCDRIGLARVGMRRTSLRHVWGHIYMMLDNRNPRACCFEVTVVTIHCLLPIPATDSRLQARAEQNI